MKTEFEGTRVKLRPFRREDAPALLEATRESLDELTRWMHWCEPTFSMSDSSAWIIYTRTAWDKQDAFNFGVFDRQSGKLVGTNWLSWVNRKHRFANLGYWVRTGMAGSGLATEAAKLIAQFGFGELGLNRIEIFVAADNLGSQRVAEKLGSQREGVLRERLQLEGKATDAVMFGLLAAEFRNLNSGVSSIKTHAL
jgi:RimJ/RimL family protein N-acetyltransferase